MHTVVVQVSGIDTDRAHCRKQWGRICFIMMGEVMAGHWIQGHTDQGVNMTVMGEVLDGHCIQGHTDRGVNMVVIVYAHIETQMHAAMQEQYGRAWESPRIGRTTTKGISIWKQGQSSRIKNDGRQDGSRVQARAWAAGCVWCSGKAQ